MNLNNTKLDLSEYSEEERNKILWAYSRACGKPLIEYPSDCRFYFCNPKASHITFERESLSFFKNHEFTEVKPVKRESWDPIKSIDELKVGDLIYLGGQDFVDTVAHVGSNVVVVNKENDDGDYTIKRTTINRNTINVKKKTTTYTFEPVIDDSFAIECFEAFRDGLKANLDYRWDVISNNEKQGWRAVAALKQSKDSE